MSKSVVPVGSERAVSRAEASPFALLQDEINRLFEGFGRNFPTLAPNAALPRIDVSETNESIDITAELPGLEAKDVQLNLSDNVLSIRGEKKNEHADRQKDYHLVERSFGSFARSVQLPEGFAQPAQEQKKPFSIQSKKKTFTFQLSNCRFLDA